MRQIDVQITKGQIEQFTVVIKDNLPEISAMVGLFTANEKRVSSFAIGTQGYHDSRFDLPMEMIRPILQISEKLEEIVIRECNKQLCLLEASKEINI